MSRATKSDRNCDIAEWEEGVPDCGLPAANPARLGRPAIDLEHDRAEYAKRLAAWIAHNPQLLDEDIVKPQLKRVRKPIAARAGKVRAANGAGNG